jgi:CRP-like cAMP-binding protein
MMQAVQQYLDRISPISDHTWKSIERILKEKPYAKGNFFAKSGRMENSFGIVLDGIFRAYITKDNGSQYTKTFFTPIYFKMPISFVGAFSALVTQSVNHVNIEALTDARVLEGDYADWLKLINEHKEVADWARKLTEMFFVGKEIREFEYFTLQADKRYQLFRQRYPELENLVNQYYIAQFLGITPTQLSRIRKKIFNGG